MRSVLREAVREGDGTLLALLIVCLLAAGSVAFVFLYLNGSLKGIL